MNAPFRVERQPGTSPRSGDAAAPGPRDRRRPSPGAVTTLAAPRSRRAFWVLSDLRLDRDPDFALPEPPACDAVLVAGNVAEDLAASLRRLARLLAGRRPGVPVFFVPGNVEHRSGVPLVEALARGRELAAALGLVLLADDATRLGPPAGGGTVVIGATLWTDWELGASMERGRARVAARTA